LILYSKPKLTSSDMLDPRAGGDGRLSGAMIEPLGDFKIDESDPRLPAAAGGRLGGELRTNYKDFHYHSGGWWRLRT
jgi:hypothetical protein